MDTSKPPQNATSHASLEVSQHGVYKLFVKRSQAFVFGCPSRTIFVDGIAQILRFMGDIFSLGPHLFVVVVVTRFFWSLESALKLWTSGLLLSALEEGLSRGKPAFPQIIYAVCVQLAAAILTELLRLVSIGADSRLKQRTENWHQEELMKAQISMDLATAQETNKSSDNGRSWDAFEGILDVAGNIVSATGQLGFVYSQSTSQSSGVIFLTLCLADPLYQQFAQPSLWSKQFVSYVSNPHFVYMQSLLAMTDMSFRAEVLAGDLMGFIFKQYQAASAALGDISRKEPYETYGQQGQGFLGSVGGNVARNLPMIYHGLNMMRNPSQTSLAQFSILQQSASTMRRTMSQLVYMTSELGAAVALIEDIYSRPNSESKVKDALDLLDYRGGANSKGMEFELRDVSFTYPGEKAKVALKNVNLKIKAGQLVVFVGENGGGKSSIIKLLCRLYDVTSGQILVDGHDIKSYKINDLRRSTSTLTQDHQLYPLSVRSNIGLGNIDLMHDDDVVRESARLGGASGFIEKLEGGWENVLTPVSTMISNNTGSLPKDDPLLAEYREIEKQSEVSGGEKQRLVAARTFMRFTSGKINFVAVDEPSSALDPQGEFDLFERLREARKGKTMVFVTHRFGHLTKFADLIVCIKDGSVVEQGTHSNLMTMDGEYSKLYNVQAQAFTTDTK